MDIKKGKIEVISECSHCNKIIGKCPFCGKMFLRCYECDKPIDDKILCVTYNEHYCSDACFEKFYIG